MSQFVSPTAFHQDPTQRLEAVSSIDPSTEALTNNILKRGVNLGQLIAKTYLMVEEASNKKAHLKIDELENHQKKLTTVSRFLTTIETQLAGNTNGVSLDPLLVQEMRQYIDHDLLKTSLSVKEAEVLKIAFTRHSQIIMQQVSHLSRELNNAVDESTELLQIARRCLEMIHQLQQTFTANQRSR